MSKGVKRLFREFQPSHYQLELMPDAKQMKFAGKVIIDGKKTGRPSKRITFHQNGLTITSAKITNLGKKGSQSIEVSRINHHKSLHEVRLHSDELLYPGPYKIELAFKGTITRPMQGIYPCFFKHKGQDKMLIATQFESHHAREAFPCIDEPEAKATFDLQLTIPSGEIVIANTPIKGQKKLKTNTITTFETAPIMSTYLLAFVYGEMHAVAGKTKSGVEVKSWATVAQPKTHLNYANSEAVKLLEFFEDYFEVAFPLKKLDQVALPDFDSLAMENWGLITYREVGLLADPKNRSISGEQLITMVIAHELSHQWFGNLVTMKWWDDLWLNESFASIMESLAPDRLHPDWHVWEDFTSSRVIGAANRDVYKDVQSIGVTIKHPDEILSLFDPAIVYAKGARILKMMFDFIGEEAFRKGLTSYFKKFAFKNTSRGELWQELSNASNLDIGSLMTPWIEQSGTPELMVKKSKNSLELTQKRFLLDGEDKQTKWNIPLLSNQKIDPRILKNSNGTVKYSGSEQPTLNPSGSGHYIVNYQDSGMREQVRNKIVDRTLSSEGRIIAINDMLLGIQKGSYSLTDALELVAQCPREDREAVWSVFGRTIGFAQLLTDDDKQSEKLLAKFRRDLSEHWFKKLGWSDKVGDDPNTKQLRTTAIALSVGGESKEAIDTALAKMYKAKTVEALPAEQRAIIAGAAIRFGDAKYIKKFMDEYVSSPNPDIQQAIISALCSTRDPKVAKLIVKWGMYNDDIIRPQDIDHWFVYLMRNPHTREVAWEWLVDRWPHLMKLYGDGKKMEYFIWYASRPISSPVWQKRYKEFFEPKTSSISMKRNILISFSEIQARVDWRKRDQSKITSWLESYAKTSGKK
ncbi:MAG TPA: M1 family metallopeptidase [Patescibacteria group bacterium]|nr:M1 family metallopeptidase [Patescibacteria group bacterium]